MAFNKQIDTDVGIMIHEFNKIKEEDNSKSIIEQEINRLGIKLESEQAKVILKEFAKNIYKQAKLNDITNLKNKLKQLSEILTKLKKIKGQAYYYVISKIELIINKLLVAWLYEYEKH